MEGLDKACSTLCWQMMRTLRHGGLGLHMQSDDVSDAAFVDGAGQAEHLKGHPAARCPLQGVSGASVREQWSSLHERYSEESKWDTETKDQPTVFLDSRNGLRGAQQLVRTKGDGASQLPTCCLATTSTPRRGSATLPGSVARPEGSLGPS